MTYKVSVEVHRRATVEVEAADDDEAFWLAELAVLNPNCEADWGTPVVDATQIISAYEDEDSMSDIAYEERKDEQVA